MFATPETIDDLLELQQCMLARTQAQRQLDELPQRQEILRLRQKKAQIEAKSQQVETLLQQARQELSRISDDDERMDFHNSSRIYSASLPVLRSCCRRCMVSSFQDSLR